MLECASKIQGMMVLIIVLSIVKVIFFWLPTEMMGLIGAGNNPMVGMTVAVAVAIEEASK